MNLLNVRRHLQHVQLTCEDMLERDGKHKHGLRLAPIDRANLNEIRFFDSRYPRGKQSLHRADVMGIGHRRSGCASHTGQSIRRESREWRRLRGFHASPTPLCGQNIKEPLPCYHQ